MQDFKKIKEAAELHNKEKSFLWVIPHDVLEYIFSFLRKKHVEPTALTCMRFSKLFKRPQLRNIIMGNKAVDYYEMNNAQLQSMIYQRPHECIFILRIARDRFMAGKMDMPMLRTIISCCPLNIVREFGRFFDFIDDSTDQREAFIFNLSDIVVASPEYYSGLPEYNNNFFMMLVDSLGCVNLDNIEKSQVLLNRIINCFQYAYITLPDNATEKSKLKDVFENYFAYRENSPCNTLHL